MPEKDETKQDKNESNRDTNADSWQEYKSSEGKYSVSMPGKVAEETENISIDDSDRTVEEKIASSELENSAYAVGYFDFPADYTEELKEVEKQKDKVDSILSDAIESAVADLGISTDRIKEESIEVDNASCRKFSTPVRVEGKDGELKGMVCLDENRLYEIVAAGYPEEMAQKADRFLNSFKIEQ